MQALDDLERAKFVNQGGGMRATEKISHLYGITLFQT